MSTYNECPNCEDGEPVCEACFLIIAARMEAEYKAGKLSPADEHEPCEEQECQECCPHDERDHGICLDCGHEEDPGAAIDRAMDYFEDR